MRLALVGIQGAGKSTLAALIPRVYEVGEGELFIDGVDVNRIPIARLRTSIATAWTRSSRRSTH